MFNVEALTDERRYNVAPPQDVPIIRQDEARNREMAIVRWGLIPHWAKDPSDLKARMINARSETMASKPAYRTAFKHRRCLVPAAGFCEWKKSGRTKQPYFIRRKDGEPVAFAGLWDRWQRDGEAIETCVILTTDSNHLIKDIHDRMPVILKPDDFELWLEPEVRDLESLKHLLAPYPLDDLEAYPVTKAVGDPRASGPELLEPTSTSHETTR